MDVILKTMHHVQNHTKKVYNIYKIEAYKNLDKLDIDTNKTHIVFVDDMKNSRDVGEFIADFRTFTKECYGTEFDIDITHINNEDFVSQTSHPDDNMRNPTHKEFEMLGRIVRLIIPTNERTTYMQLPCFVMDNHTFLEKQILLNGTRCPCKNNGLIDDIFLLSLGTCELNSNKAALFEYTNSKKRLIIFRDPIYTHKIEHCANKLAPFVHKINPTIIVECNKTSFDNNGTQDACAVGIVHLYNINTFNIN